MNRWKSIAALGLAVGLGLGSGPVCAGDQTASPNRPPTTVLLRADSPTTETQRVVRRPSYPPDDYQAQRDRMVTGQIIGRDVREGDVTRAMRRVPRHLFVPPGDRGMAYMDMPLPIGHGQTISQPYIVAYMTELLALKADARVLEIGTGSGYQAAILAERVGEVVTIEIIDALARSAAALFKELGCGNITVVSGDGYFGWEERAPYDAIMVTAAADHVPPPLIAQLKPGGRMVIPVGRTGWTQNLLQVDKRADGSISTRNLLSVRFVPLTRERR